MLLWELVSVKSDSGNQVESSATSTPRRPQRLPFNKRCSARAKSGLRCRGKIRPGSDYCSFHDPTLSPEQRRQNAAKGGRSRKRLAHLPDGYLRKLTSRAAVGQCMDRLYREVRLGIITPEMGYVLFNVLCRIMDAGLYEGKAQATTKTRRSKADLIRPKLGELLSSAEQAAWQRAVDNAPASIKQASRPQDRATRQAAAAD